MRSKGYLALGAAFVSLACGVSQSLGVAPVAVSIVALATWSLVAARRIGWLLALPATVAGWMMVLLAASAIAHVGLPASAIASVGLITSTFIAAWVARRHPPVVAPRSSLVPIAAASVGTVVWAVAFVVGRVTGSGAGLSWVMYKDSTMNVWGVRRMLAAGGIDSFTAGANLQPLQDALALALVPIGTGTSASAADVEGALLGYASLWAVLIGCASILLGALVAMGATEEPRPRRLTLVSSAITSLAVLTAPVSGVLIDLGQVNGHVMLVLIAASLVSCVSMDNGPELTLGIQLACFGLLAACWIPFAIVPLVCTVGVIWRHRTRFAGHVKTRSEASLGWVLAGGSVAAVSSVVWAWPIVRPAIKEATAGSTYIGVSEVATFSRPGYWESYTNPAWPPLAVMCAVALTALAWRLREHLVARVAAAALATMAIGFAVVAAPWSSPWDALPYYPAKYLWIATVIGLALCACLGVAILSRGRRVWDTLTASAAVAALAAALLLAPSPKGIDTWGLAPWDVATGHHVGTHDEVAGGLLAVTSDDTLTLPWRLDPPHDATIALMASAFSPGLDELLFSPTRYVLRYYRNDFSAEVACELARADTRPVRLLTADARLDSQIANQCPDQRIEVVVVSD